MTRKKLIRLLNRGNPNDIVKISDLNGDCYWDIGAVENDTAYNEDTKEAKYRKMTAVMKEVGYTDDDVVKGSGFKKTVTLYMS